MTIADELAKLKELRDSGALTEEEFEQAKASVLAGASGGHHPEGGRPAEPVEGAGGLLAAMTGDESLASDPVFDLRGSTDNSLGRAANRYVDLQIVATIVGLILFVLVFLFMFGQMSEMNSGFGGFGPQIVVTVEPFGR
jgi:hypothetical protein